MTSILRGFCLLVTIILASACCPKKTPQQKVTKAIAVMKGTVNGTIKFSAVSDGTRVEGSLKGLPDGEHGFHVHQLGDLTSCTASKGHYNPLNKKHGAWNKAERHVGDLKQLTAKNGVASINYVDPVIPLVGEHSIVGRMLVVHAGKDDLGLGGNAGSESTGNAGARLNCAVIGVLEP